MQHIKTILVDSDTLNGNKCQLFLGIDFDHILSSLNAKEADSFLESLICGSRFGDYCADVFVEYLKTGMTPKGYYSTGYLENVRYKFIEALDPAAKQTIDEKDAVIRRHQDTQFRLQQEINILARRLERHNLRGTVVDSDYDINPDGNY